MSFSGYHCLHFKRQDGENVMTYRVSVIIERKENWFVAYCPELEVASQGKTIEEAKNNLKEAVELYLKEADPSEIDLPKEPPYVSSFDIAV